MNGDNQGINRRRFTVFFAGFGLAATALPRLLWAEVEKTGGVSKEALIGAEKLAGLEFTDDERELMLKGLEELREDYAKLREVPLDNSVPPALRFEPLLPGMEIPERPLTARTVPAVRGSKSARPKTQSWPSCR